VCSGIFEPDVNFQEIVHTVVATNADAKRAMIGDRMDMHKNAPLLMPRVGRPWCGVFLKTG
jgi:hypothetical protein